VFVNLVNNAQDAMPDGGTLTIATRKLDEFAELEFKDTGVGIGEENIKQVFAPLFTTKAKGTGLGLSICHNIVAEHHGTLSVASRQGEGATFTIRLPWNGAGPQGQKEGTA
jgi:two-component system NtrC family sensor kinase